MVYICELCDKEIIEDQDIDEMHTEIAYIWDRVVDDTFYFCADCWGDTTEPSVVPEKFTINPSPVRKDHVWGACKCYVWPFYPEYRWDMGWCDRCERKIKLMPGVFNRGEARRSFEEINGRKVQTLRSTQID